MKKQRIYKVAIVGGCLSSRGGGVPRSISHQALALSEGGHEVTLYAGYNKQYPFTPKELGIEQCRTYVSRLWGPGVLGFFPKALLKLWNKAGDFDVIHLNGAWNLTTFFAGIIAHFRKVPYVISCRSHYGDYHFSRKSLLKKFLFKTMERISIKNAYAIHVTADWEATTSWRAVKLAPRVIKIPNPVNLDDFRNPPKRQCSRDRLALEPDAFYVLHLGRLGKQKNLGFLIEAFHQAHLGDCANLVLIGPPEMEEKRKLEALAQQLGIADRVTFIDFSGGRERCDWLAAADLFALPSFDENFCVAAIESVASGTHCFLSPNIGVIEFLPPPLATVLPIEQDAWAEALAKAYRNRKKQQIPPKATFDAFTTQNIGNAWIDFYATSIG